MHQYHKTHHPYDLSLVKLGAVITKIKSSEGTWSKNFNQLLKINLLQHPKLRLRFSIQACQMHQYYMYKTHHPYKFGEVRTSSNLEMAIKGHLHQRLTPALQILTSSSIWNLSNGSDSAFKPVWCINVAQWLNILKYMYLQACELQIVTFVHIYWIR